MKVVLTRRVLLSDGYQEAGTELELAANVAQRLIAKGSATEVKQPANEKPVKKGDEPNK